jgi:alanine racemase
MTKKRKDNEDKNNDKNKEKVNGELHKIIKINFFDKNKKDEKEIWASIVEAYNQKYTVLQAKRLREVGEILVKNGIKYKLLHAGCTASTIVNQATHFNMVRIGVGLYGLWPSSETKALANYRSRTSIVLKPVLTWKTKIIQIKELPAKTPIGYDCTYVCSRKTRIAVLPVGYWDGYDRKLSNCGEVLIRGKRAPIRGRVCMNLIMVEVTKIPNVKIGDEVVLIGKQGREEISADEIAKKVGTINYEIITRINPLMPRIYK